MIFYFLLFIHFIHWTSSVKKELSLFLFVYSTIPIQHGYLTSFPALKFNTTIIHFVAQIVPTLAI